MSTKYTSDGEPSLAAPVAELPGYWGTPASPHLPEGQAARPSQVVRVAEPYQDFGYDLLLAPPLWVEPEQKKNALAAADRVIEHARAAEQDKRVSGLRSVLVLRASDDPEGTVVGIASAVDPSVNAFGLC